MCVGRFQKPCQRVQKLFEPRNKRWQRFVACSIALAAGLALFTLSAWSLPLEDSPVKAHVPYFSLKPTVLAGECMYM